ncbi:MAG: malonate transporter subunit MadL [Pseudomonadota bacterium]
MIVYGVAILAACYLVGVVAGDLIGSLIGVNANVGGVGIAMLLLILITSKSSARIELGEITRSGITFWSAMYIPIVIAMAAKQNVIGALSSGWMAIIAGTLAVVASFAMIPVLAKVGRKPELHR